MYAAGLLSGVMSLNLCRLQHTRGLHLVWGIEEAAGTRRNGRDADLPHSCQHSWHVALSPGERAGDAALVLGSQDGMHVQGHCSADALARLLQSPGAWADQPQQVAVWEDKACYDEGAEEASNLECSPSGRREGCIRLQAHELISEHGTHRTEGRGWAVRSGRGNPMVSECGCQLLHVGRRAHYGRQELLPHRTAVLVSSPGQAATDAWALPPCP